jgi:hypothetical protein
LGDGAPLGATFLGLLSFRSISSSISICSLLQSSVQNGMSPLHKRHKGTHVRLIQIIRLGNWDAMKTPSSSTRIDIFGCLHHLFLKKRKMCTTCTRATKPLNQCYGLNLKKGDTIRDPWQSNFNLPTNSWNWRYPQRVIQEYYRLTASQVPNQ